MKTVLAAVLALAAVPASAGTLFQSIPDLTAETVQAGYCSSCNAFLPFRIYDGFTLASASTVKTVTFALDTSFYAGASVNVGFFNRSGALPGSAIANYTFAPSDFVSSYNVPTASERSRALATVAIPALALAAGSYDISFFNAAGLSIPAFANPGGSLYQSGNFFQPGQFYAGQSAGFSLAGSVPEPASWALMMVGFAFVGVASRRRAVVAS